MTDAYVVALDQGTTSSRAVLFNGRGDIAGIAQPFQLRQQCWGRFAVGKKILQAGNRGAEHLGVSKCGVLGILSQMLHRHQASNNGDDEDADEHPANPYHQPSPTVFH